MLILFLIALCACNSIAICDALAGAEERDAPLTGVVRLLSEQEQAALSLALNEYPFVMTHDAATGYIDASNIVARWTKTQNDNFTTQLNCGARAFDLRPAISKAGALLMHHGPIVVQHKMADAAEEVVTWAHANPTDLVILYVTDCVCEGSSPASSCDCTDQASEALQLLHIPVVTDCGKLTGLTYGQALNMSLLPDGGGHVLAVFGCMNENYVPAIMCYVGFDTCYDATTGKKPMDAFYNYMNSTTAVAPPSDGSLVMVQGHWQEDADSIVAGTLHNSSLIKDNERSQLNQKVTQAVLAKQYEYINFLEVNNVCDGGSQLYAALQKRTQLQQEPQQQQRRRQRLRSLEGIDQGQRRQQGQWHGEGVEMQYDL